MEREKAQISVFLVACIAVSFALWASQKRAQTTTWIHMMKSVNIMQYRLRKLFLLIYIKRISVSRNRLTHQLLADRDPLRERTQ